uniref:NADH-ubiquinone oxidoreductase chain 2 n=1 Tax=Helicella itala TaxID=76043 RepID=A0A1S5R335_9EUPU|nr:NADH dehydrogenase subunit 2 [Helicella itala]
MRCVMNFFSLSFLLGVSVLSGLASASWIMIILMMELGLFFFVFLCMEYNLLSLSRSCIKYFIVQSVSSLLLLLGGLMCFTLCNNTNQLASLIFLVGIIMKLGAFPMLFWVAPVFLELPFLLIGFVGCPLKVLPLMMYSNYYMSFSTPLSLINMNFVSLLSMVFGVSLGLYMKTIRGMLGASSITHTGWFILSIHSASIIKYFCCYTVSLIMLLVCLWSQNSLMGALNLMGLGGLPPFSVFVGKMIVISASLSCNISEVFIMLAALVSAVSLFYYLKFSFNMYLYWSNNMVYVLGPSSYLFLLINFGFALLFMYI